MMRRLTCLLIPAAALLASGCASPPTNFYTLSAATIPALPATTLSVAVGPVSIPGDVDRPQMVVNTGPNQARVDEFNRWAGPLQDGIARVVAENLVALLGSPQVTLFPQPLSMDAGYRVAIEVQSFVSTLGESASLDAVWTVRRMKDGKHETGRASVREPIQEKGYDALAAAHSRAIAKLSNDIADAVRTIDRSPVQANPVSATATGKQSVQSDDKAGH
jgi:uncharacterized lipoprotein YmbA